MSQRGSLCRETMSLIIASLMAWSVLLFGGDAYNNLPREFKLTSNVAADVIYKDAVICENTRTCVVEDLPVWGGAVRVEAERYRPQSLYLASKRLAITNTDVRYVYLRRNRKNIPKAKTGFPPACKETKETRKMIGDRSPELCYEKEPYVPYSVVESGHCMMRYDVDIAGKPVNVRSKGCMALEFAEPAKVYVKACKYKPAITDGRAIYRRYFKDRVEFAVTSDNGWKVPEPRHFSGKHRESRYVAVDPEFQSQGY